jgi:hypothetical protein
VDSDTSPSWWGDGELLMAIDLGYDESGSDDVLLVTFQLSITEQARKLRRKWRSMLREARIPYFHSKEFNTPSHGVFGDMPRADRLELLQALAELTRQHIFIGMTAKITKATYDQKTKTNEFRSQWGTAYTFAVVELLAGAYFFAKYVGLRPEFNVLIEDGHRHASQALQHLDILKKQGFNPEMVGCKILTAGLGSKADHPILQAADMLAYSEWQKMRGRDMATYDAMHFPNLRFQPEFLDFDEDMVPAIVKGTYEYMAQRRAWGKRKPLTKTAEGV